MMNDLTPRGRQVLALARKEAERFNHNYVGTEHLLLGLIKLGEGVAVNVLQRMGLGSRHGDTIAGPRIDLDDLLLLQFVLRTEDKPCIVGAALEIVDDHPFDLRS